MPSSDEGGDLHLYEDTKAAEVRDIVLQQKINSMKSWFCETVMGLIKNEEHFNLLEKMMSPIEPALKAAISKDYLFANTIDASNVTCFEL